MIWGDGEARGAEEHLTDSSRRWSRKVLRERKDEDEQLQLNNDEKFSQFNL